VLEALRHHEDRYLGRHVPDPRRTKVLRRLLACRTQALGAHLIVCEDCGVKLPVYNSCLDRHCPQCQGPATAAWLEARRARMLPVPHFQTVFTLPEQLRPVAMANQELVYALMMRTSASVLQDLAAQHLGARLGILSVLHTWTSELCYHPHVHHLITAGGLQLDDSRWVPSRLDWLFPQKVMGAMFKGRFLEGLEDAQRAGELWLPGEPVKAAKDFRATLRALRRRHTRWVVHEEAPRGRPADHVVGYLARYVKRVAIADARIASVTDTRVVIRTRKGLLPLDGVEFVRRFLLHVLPRGFRKVRYFGLYAPGNTRHRLATARCLIDPDACELEPESSEQSVGDTTTEPEPRWCCPCCASVRITRIFFGRFGPRRARAPP
jgi:hypothetical protein